MNFAKLLMIALATVTFAWEKANGQDLEERRAVTRGIAEIPISPGQYASKSFQMHDDLILIRDRKAGAIVGHELTSRRTFDIKLPQPFRIRNFGYIESHDLILVMGLEVKETGDKEKPSTYNFRTFVFDPVVPERPVGTASIGNKDDAYWYQIISNGHKTFTNNFKHYAGPTTDAVLQQVDVISIGSNIILKPLGESFNYLYEGTSRHDYHQRFIVPELENEDNIIVFDEYQNSAYTYKLNSNDFLTFDKASEGSRDFSLQERTPFSRNWTDNIQKLSSTPTFAEVRKAYYSLGLITGVELFENKYLIAYESPNPQNKAYSGKFPGTKAQQNAPLFVLRMQAMDKDLKPIGPAVIEPGAYFLGVSYDEPYIARIVGSTAVIEAVMMGHTGRLQQDIVNTSRDQ
jgi:hypothetical protein